MTEKELAIQNIKELVRRKGIFYALIMILVQDSQMRVSQMKEIDFSERISCDEVFWLMGYLIQENSSFIYDYPNNLNQLLLKSEIHNALKKLQYSYLQPFFDNGIESIHSNESIVSTLQESIHYDGDSAYDYEYADFAIMRYKYVSGWLKENKSLDIVELSNLVKHLEQFLLEKTDIPYFFNQSEKKHFWGHNPSVEEENHLRMIQYAHLMSKDIFSKNQKQQEIATIEFCKKLLSLLTFSKNDFVSFSCIDAFIKNFTFDITINNTLELKFDEPGRFNILDAKPIIKIDDDCYFVPYLLKVFKAIYETPYYWLISDNKYSKTASRLIGKAHEEMVSNLLRNVYGHENTYTGIKIRTGKGKESSEIDTLCILNNKVLCVQVKSKRLTEKSKLGDYSSLISDFDKSVNNAYEQGITCKKAILSKEFSFVDKDNNPISLPIRNTDEVYIMCIVCGEYEGLATQSKRLFKEKACCDLPLICSIFDLHLITTYLNNPYDFTYYVRKRVENWKYFAFTNEIAPLGFHLKNNLHRLEDQQFEIIDISC